MIKALIFFAVLLAIAFGGSWLADRPGEIIINWPWMDTGLEVSLLVGFLLLMAAMACAIILWVVVRGIWRSPKSVTGFFSSRRRDKGYKALSTGMIAVGVGDLDLARKQAAKARKLIGEEPMTLMLEAQTAQLAGDVTLARQSFESMLDLEETRALGRRGLYIEAQRRGDMEEALQMAKAATDDGKKTPGWAGSALFDMQTAAQDWKGALVTLSQNHASKHVNREEFRRNRAVILTAQAMDMDDEHGSAAEQRTLLQEACKLAPGLVPAVVLAAELMNDAKDYRKASKLIEAAWRIGPHPDLARTYAYVKSGDTAVERLKRIRSLYALMPDHWESRIALAHALLDAREWAEARPMLVALAEEKLTPRICMMMAELEEGDTNDFGLVRQWLSRAVGAHRDPVWTADGQVSDVWQPISPVTGKLDAFEWKVPVLELAHNDQPILESRDLAEKPEPDEKDMVLISAESPSVSEVVETKPEVEDIPLDDADKSAEVAQAAENSGKEESVAEPKVEAPKPDDATKAEPVAQTAAAEAKSEEKAAQPAKDEPSAEKDVSPEEVKDAKAEVKKPKEVEFALPHAPDDPGPKKDSVPPSSEKRFRLF